MGTNVWLERRPSKKGHVYTLRWKDPTTGKIRSQSTKESDKRLADRYVSQKIEDLRNGVSDDVDKSTWDGFVQTVLRRIRAIRKPSTVIDLKNTADRFGKIIRPDSPTAVTSNEILRFLEAREAMGCRPSTREKDRRNLRRLFNEGMKAEPPLVRKNPVKGVPSIKASEADWHWFKDDEIRKLMGSADVDWEAMIAVAYLSGLRRGEIQNLVWTDIDLDRLTITINAKNAGGRHLLYDAKDYERRTVPITEYIRDLLEKRKAKAHVATNPYVFLAKDRYEHLLKRPPLQGRSLMNNFNRTWRTMCARLDLPQGAFHDLRKSCISNWADRGVPLHKCQELAGHSDIETTRKYYTRVEDAIDVGREASSAFTPPTERTRSTPQKTPHLHLSDIQRENIAS